MPRKTRNDMQPNGRDMNERDPNARMRIDALINQTLPPASNASARRAAKRTIDRKRNK